MFGKDKTILEVKFKLLGLAHILLSTQIFIVRFGMEGKLRCEIKLFEQFNALC